MKGKRNRRSAIAARRRADLRLIRTALVGTALLILLPDAAVHVLVSAACVGLLAGSVWGIAWLLNDDVTGGAQR